MSREKSSGITIAAKYSPDRTPSTASSAEVTS